jgi:23S rRNA pseudouridine2605 synthase
MAGQRPRRGSGGGAGRGGAGKPARRRSAFTPPKQVRLRDDEGTRLPAPDG